MKDTMTDERAKKLFSAATEAKKKGRPLTAVFEEFAAEYGMAKGSVRNAYYAAAKRAAADKRYGAKVCGGNKPQVGKIVEFDKAEARVMLKKILIKATDGRSVRGSISLIAKDAKTALRYQNKYRSMLVSDRETVESVVAEIKRERGECYNPYSRRGDAVLEKLKSEINALYERIAADLKTKNAALELKVKRLEAENAALKKSAARSVASDYFESVDSRPKRRIEGAK